MTRVVWDVVAGEGAASALRRAHERAREALEERALLLRARFVRARPQFPILNVLSTPATPRLGGVQVHLLARLHAERALRPVALFTPGLLTLSRPHMHALRVDAIRDAIAITGARAIHIEGAHGMDVASVLRLIDEGLQVVISLHDFALISNDPHHLDNGRRAEGLQLLRRAGAVIYPSRYLEAVHRYPGIIIPAGIPRTAPPKKRATKTRRIAFAGSVKPRKGAALMKPVVEALRGRGIEWFAFGGGDVEFLRDLRKLRVNVHGQYAMGSLPSLLARNGIDVVLLLSTEPELYSLTLSESWLAGVPAIAFAHGAIEERVREHGGGWLVPLDDGSAGIVAAIERWLDGEPLPRVPEIIETADDAARACVALYDRLRR
jgi:glycosyltransferase involved in cell wall biosynthesis